MSPRRSDPRTRRALIDAAARLLAEEGPQSLSTRRLATETGSSTMAVYTHFGSMSELVREIAREGFAGLQRDLTSAEPTGDPVADMAVLGRAYLHSALADPHLYAVMFGGLSLGGFAPGEEDRQRGRYTLGNVVECAGRCIAARRFRPGSPELVAHQMWIAVHGIVTLQSAGYLIEPYDGDRCFEAQLVGLMVGAGDSLDAAVESVERSAGQFAAGVAAAQGGH